MLNCNSPLERPAALMRSADQAWPNRLRTKSAGQHRKIAVGSFERQSSTGRLADHRRTPHRCSQQPPASAGGSCSGSQQNPVAGARRSQLGPPEQRSQARTGPRAIHRRREHLRHAAERTPSGRGAARSGRQPFAAAAPASIDDRPPASCHHPVPKSVSPSPAPHIRLICALHKFLQGRGAILWDRPTSASRLPASPLRYGFARHHDNQLTKPPFCAPQLPPERQWQHPPHKPLTCENLPSPPCTARTEVIQS